jgi:hypothetical protein
VSTTVTEQVITTTVSGTVIRTTVTPQQITAGVVDGGVTHHALLSGLGADDHPHYLTQARGDARYWPLATDLATQAELDAWTAAHLAAADPHPQYLTPAEAGGLYWPLAIDLATQAELDAHAAAADPHPQYLTSAEAGLLYAALSHTHDDRYYTESESDALLAGKAAASHTHPWGQITGTPTTLSGYGITDGAPAAAEYLTLAAHASLSAERVLTAGTNITLDTSTPGQLVISAAGGGGGTIDGSGTAGRVAQWSDSDTLQAANLIAPANLLTLIAAGAYNLTIPASGTAALLETGNVFGAAQSIALDNATTAAVDTLLTLAHTSSGTPATGFGSGIAWQLETSTTPGQAAGGIDVEWINAAHAHRTSRMTLATVVNGALARALRYENTTAGARLALANASGVEGITLDFLNSTTPRFAIASSGGRFFGAAASTSGGAFAYDQAGFFGIERRSSAAQIGSDLGAFNLMLWPGGQFIIGGDAYASNGGSTAAPFFQGLIVASNQYYKVLRLRGYVNHWEDILTIERIDTTKLSWFDYTGALTCRPQDSGTANVLEALTVEHDSDATPAAGFGVRMRARLKSTTTSGIDAAAIDTSWANATHASRQARLALRVGDSTGLREALRLDATGSGVTLDAYGTTSISKDTSGSTDTFLSLKKASARNWDARIDPGGNLVLQPDGYASLVLPAFNGSAPVQTWQNNSGSTVAQVDQTTSSSETPLLLLADGSVRRVKVGAAGTGPGGSGRALYMD